MPVRRAILSSCASFWAVAAIGLVAAATNAAASPLYGVYQLQFRFSATTLTLLFSVDVVVVLVTLVLVGSVSDYLGRRPVLLTALAQRFVGAYRATLARAASDDRAGLITAIYIVSYLATGIPAVIGGIATTHFGLHQTALVYAVAVAVLAEVAASLLIRQMTGGRARHGTRHPDMPPGPCTVPPCPPTSPRLRRSEHMRLIPGSVTSLELRWIGSTTVL